MSNLPLFELVLRDAWGPALSVRFRALASSSEKCNPASWRHEANWGEIIAAGDPFVKRDRLIG